MGDRYKIELALDEVISHYDFTGVAKLGRKCAYSELILEWLEVLLTTT